MDITWQEYIHKKYTFTGQAKGLNTHKINIPYIIIIMLEHWKSCGTINSIILSTSACQFLFLLAPRTEPASLERNPVTPARGPPACSGSSGTDTLYALRNSSLTSFSLWALTDWFLRCVLQFNGYTDTDNHQVVIIIIGTTSWCG